MRSRDMDEGIGGREYFSDANIIDKRDNNGKLKPVGRLTGKRKNNLEKSRKKRGKRRESPATSTGATAVEDGEDEESTSDLPAVVSSTSCTESMTKAEIKEMKSTKPSGKRTPNFAKIVKSLNAAPFVFQRRISRIDWRKLHTIDVDRVIREVDLDALESVLDTITFADIQGEDTRNFSEANFIKVFRLAQLMVEYLLHVQELLASHKETLLATGAEMQRRVEKDRHNQAKLRSELSVLRHNFKQAKKTVRAYEIMLRVQNKFQHRQQKLQQSQRKQNLQAQHEQHSAGAQTVRCCPLCDKLFESAFYLDLHIARRHPKSNEIPEDKIMAAVSKAEEAVAASIRAEASATLQAEMKLLQAMSQAELQRVQAVSQLQISSLEATLRESNAKLLEVQSQLQGQTIRRDISSAKDEKKDDKMQDRLKEMDEKLQSIQAEMKHLNQENSSLTKDLTSAHSEGIDQTMKLKGRDQGAEEMQDKPGKWKDDRPASAERKGKERRKWQHSLSSSPERSESEGRLVIYNQMASNRSSAPERKRKHNLPRPSSSPEKIDTDSSVTVAARHSSSPVRHRKYKAQQAARFDDPAEVHISQRFKQWKASLRPKQRGDMSSASYRQSPPSGSRTPTSKTMPQKSRAGIQISRVEITRDLETEVHTPPLEASLATFRVVGDKTLEMAKAEVEEDLARAGGNRLLNEDGGKVASKIAIFETKVKTKKIKREEVENIRRSEDEVGQFREMKERLDAKEKRSFEEAMEEEARRKAEIADAVIMDVGEDHPSIPPEEKEKWLEEHPYKPIPQRPHVVSKYPHPPDVFSTTREKLAHRLDEQLGGEMKKFGFGKDIAAISDSVYNTAKAVLEKEQKNRVSSLQSNHKKTLEYERGAILWQTQRAVHDRDLQIIEGRFEADSDSSTQQSPSECSRSPSPSPSPSRYETDDDSLRKRAGRFGRSTSPVIKSPQSSRSRTLSPTIKSPVTPLSKDDEQVKRATHIATIVERLKGASANNRGRDKKQVTYNTLRLRSPPQSHVIRFKGSHLSAPQSPPRDANRTHSPTYLFPTIAKFKRAEESNSHNRDDEHNGDTFGLGEWESDDDVPASTALRNTGEHSKANSRKHPESSKDLKADSNSNDDSEESKIFQELDAEIDEIIRL